MKLIECVPNFSEGRRKEIIDAIAGEARKVPGVTVLDCENDPNHNRMVLTFVGDPEAVETAAIACSREAIKSIDLTKHTGEHPRMGAVDVVPFVPLRDVSMEECVSIAKSFARKYSQEFDVPVFLYEEAATTPERKDLAKVREGQFEGLRDLIGKDPSKTPDYGPNRIHPTAGATAVGARPILIAYNVNLKTTDLSVAKQVARQVRGRDGGLAFVKALGFQLKDKNMVQVSMNLTDFRKSSMYKAYELVSTMAEHHGVEVAESEIVGLVPTDALVETAEYYLKLQTFKRDQIIENRIYDVAGPSTIHENLEYPRMSLSDFAASVASDRPYPGGGSVAAYTGELAAALVSMVCKLTIGKKGYESKVERVASMLGQSERMRSELEGLVTEDATAYSEVTYAMKLPKSTDVEKGVKKQKLHEALKKAIETPLRTMRLSGEVLSLAKEIAETGNKNARSDAETALQLSRASIFSAWSNVKINLESLGDDPEYVEKTRKIAEPLLARVE